MLPRFNSVEERMQRLKCCVLIPTYNNDKTLKRVLDGVLQYTNNIVTVNDGSTDNTYAILEEYQNISKVHLPDNKGKGNALKLGFKKAQHLGFDFAITIDSDGQHFPEDIPVFLDALENSGTKNALFVGARNMTQADVPGKSSFGNRFSNFWFRFETGIRLTDTQCGYRLYPLKEVNELRLYTPKFEFEIEVIVKAAWNGTIVENVPVKIAYDQAERVSHFRTVPDFTRISILNTWFVIVAIFYIKPRDFYRRIKKKGVKKYFVENILKHNDSPKKKAFSIALGVFIGIAPFWGFQTLLVFGLSVFFKLNKAIAFAFSNISIPPMIPFIIYASVQVGMKITGEETIPFSFDNFSFDYNMLRHLKTYIIGSFVLATVSSLVFGIVAYIALTLRARKKVAVNNG